MQAAIITVRLGHGRLSWRDLLPKDSQTALMFQPGSPILPSFSDASS
jgi:hypothetical protein